MPHALAPLTHLVVLDFEATCDDRSPPSPQEIIELPSVLLDARTLALVDEHVSFVRPVHHPTLTPFCTALTSITQADVDDAPPFPDALAAYLAWLTAHGLPLVPAAPPGTLPYLIVTCGDWDLQTMLPAQLAASEIDFVPHPFRRWTNVKTIFAEWRGARTSGGMQRMLSLLDLELEGRHHRGIDDCRNIAKIVRALSARGHPMRATSALAPSRYPTIRVTLERDGAQVEITLAKRAVGTLLGAASDAFRRQATRAFEGERALREDADLCDLESGATIRVA
ncbi:MAG: exonuclease domain-containing protein [Sandaracinaceae bacterium]|nr:exonuclease domain-containing protein [Sandaracinaceae bacterium]